MQKYLRAVRVGGVGGVGGAGRAASAVPAAVKVEVQRPSPARRLPAPHCSKPCRQLVVIQGASFEETCKNFTEKHGRLLGFDRFEKHIRHHHWWVHPAKGREDCVCAKELALDGLFKAGREM